MMDNVCNSATNGNLKKYTNVTAANNDLVDSTSGKGKFKNETGNDLEKKVVENIHNQHQSIGKASVEPPTKDSEWYIQFKILQDGQDELKKEVSSLKKEYKEELVHDQNGDVKKDVQGDSDRKKDAVNENIQAYGFVDVGFQDEDEWLKMCDVEAHKLTAEDCKQTRNEDVPDHEIEMTDAQINCQIHKITSEFVNKSIGVAPIPKYSTHEEAGTSSFAIQSSFEGTKVYEILDDFTEEDATRMKKPLVPRVIVKEDHPFKISITEEIPVSIRDDFNKFVQSKLIQTRRKKDYEKNDDILDEEFDLGIEFIAKKTWFFELHYSGIGINETRSDIAMDKPYYLEKQDLSDPFPVISVDNLPQQEKA
ncbi:hypothetical protein A4A49_28086 [Nicotiana attenuata]|uniref:Uncharacterized protein n=1 Tax=Nicotiana attenuata TaxID=49451 RepID=A0A1J6L2E9_NICAT|nr:hypothetical protein A4A49_28086 [Nicotiana attenuata]